MKDTLETIAFEQDHKDDSLDSLAYSFYRMYNNQDKEENKPNFEGSTVSLKTFIWRNYQRG